MPEDLLSNEGVIQYEYPIFDQTNEEITNPDLTKGYLRKEYFTTHIPMIPERWHYIVKSFEFSTGEIYRVTSQNDSHIKIIDAEKGIFEYQNLEGEEEKTVVGQNIVAVIDQPMIPARDEEHIFYRYVLFTEKELADREFLTNGPALLAEAQETIEDLLLTIAELIGGIDDEEIPEDDTDETTPEEEITPEDNTEEVVPEDNTDETTPEEEIVPEDNNEGEGE